MFFRMRPEIDLFLFLLFLYPVFLFFWLEGVLDQKWCGWLKGVVSQKSCLDSTTPPPFIVVCCNLWGSWFWPDHSFSSWIMVLFIGFSHEVKLTMFFDKVEKC